MTDDLPEEGARIVFSGMTRMMRGSREVTYLHLAHDYVPGTGNMYWMRYEDGSDDFRPGTRFGDWHRLLFQKGDRVEIKESGFGSRVTVMIRSWPQQPRIITAYDLLYDHAKGPASVPL